MAKIAVIGGDGIGPEVVRAGMKVLRAAAERVSGLDLEFTEFPWGCEYYLEHGQMMPDDGLDTLSSFDALYLGAVGWPTVPDHVSLWQLLIPIRRSFDQYVNLRPARILRGVESPLRHPGSLDVTVVRENTEGEYSNSGGRLFAGPHGSSPFRIACSPATAWSASCATPSSRRVRAEARSSGPPNPTASP